MAKHYKTKTKLLVILTGFSLAGIAVATDTATQNEAGPHGTNPGGGPIPTPTHLWRQIEMLRKTNSVMARSDRFHMGQSHC